MPPALKFSEFGAPELDPREVQLAEQTLDDWARYGPKTLGSVTILIGGGEVRTFMKKR